MMTSKKPSTTTWQHHVDEQRKSGKSRKSYCEAHGLKLHQFNYYLRSTGTKRQKPSAFSRVLMPDSSFRETMPTASTARLLLGKGVMLEFGTSSEPEWIAKVIAQLQLLP